jgi:hypothetical protein
LPPPASAAAGPGPSEINLPARPQPIHEISLKLADHAANRVDIQLVERAGNVHVAVRTGDQELTKSLQTNLGDLVGRFEDKGYKTETWIPAASLHTTAAVAATGGSASHGQEQQQEQPGSWGGQQQQQNQQESGHRQQPRWVMQFAEMPDEEGTETTSFRTENP